MFKNKTRLGNNFHWEDRTPKYLNSGVVYGLCNKSCYSECVRHMNVRIGEHTGMSPLTKKQINPKTAPQSNIDCFATIQHPMTNLAF